MNKLLTKKELAERWRVAEKTIDNWRESGILTPCAGIPAIRFSLQHIAELEGTKLERFSPIERKRLEIENEKLKQENEQLKGIIANVLSETSKIINL
ncbi:histidine kinase [Clostridium sporogenes]|uniref:histidine kinase n=1 Tax=Clostridium sporogenes TaxID=1509 RepID=UPI0005F0A414|nr:histidine kinase [Clostridium sporogenes]MCW6061581.1 histidine kinase [Clostridium sporogenes]MCW6069773.1 histidine kinase [Clostridium sporogenes]MCW6122502.1 histidine kinase [Clostridium sporogenes]NFF78353.1 helix-turn-helix domain-containing protein [Clostridium sporogenes]NFU88882.1 helix-turn-helix domain-containing protein [Clostridium sporogenes]